MTLKEAIEWAEELASRTFDIGGYSDRCWLVYYVYHWNDGYAVGSNSYIKRNPHIKWVYNTKNKIIMKELETKTVVEINQGEIKVVFNEPIEGKITFADLGISEEDLAFDGGNVRMVFDLGSNKDGLSYYQMPTIEVSYKEDMGETHWICDYNGETILDKNDHHGHSTVMLLNRKKMSELEHHHNNNLIMHADFPAPVHIKAEDSYINFFS